MIDGGQTQGPPAPQRNWLRRNYLSVLIFAAVLAITVALFTFQSAIIRFRDLGYLGAFLVSVTANATIVLPMPSLLILLPIGAAFNPFLVGLVAGVGGALGEMTAYMAGYSGRKIWEDSKTYQRAVQWLRRWGILTVFVFAATPLPLDVMGLAAGNLRFPFWKYFSACLPGKIIKYIVLALVGNQFYTQFTSSPVFRDCVYAVAAAAAGVLIVLGLALYIERRTRQKGKPQ
jgi:membrane protein YqaA with SNARE-associated domain